MKIDARINLHFKPQNMLFENVCIPIDADYVEANDNDILNWILNSDELYDFCKEHSMPIRDCTIELLNRDELIEELAYDEFAVATNVDNPAWE
jgi:hypothetical protein